MSNKNKLWHGYLEAGDKSSPVLEDPRLNTEDGNYRFLYNLKADRIIKYKSDIVNAKLRDLSSDEQDIVPQLEKQFKKARKAFLGNTGAATAETEPVAQLQPANNQASIKTEINTESMETMDDTETMVDMDWGEDSLEADAVGP